MNTSRRWFQWLISGIGAILVPAIFLVGVVVLFKWGIPPPVAEKSSSDIWTCSMHPQVRLDAPGPCPICGMALIPLSQLTAERERVERQAGLETELIKHRALFKEIRTVGKIDFNERRVAYITARMDGRIDRVYADFTGTKVKANDHLVDIYSPALYTAQAELLRALDAFQNATGDKRFAAINLDAARMKLQLLGILPDQISQIEQNRQEKTHLTIYSPIGGVVIEKNVREQQYVREGDMLYRIAELDPIWLYLDIYEYDLAWIRYGQRVDVTVEAYPGDIFKGTVVFIEPYLNDETRTVKVRVNLPNTDYKLKAAMYASAVIRVHLRADGTPEATGLEGKYTCPMHPEIVAEAEGNCNLCGMPLERVPDLFPVRLQENKNEIENPNQQSPQQVLAIRRSSVLDTGRRTIAYRKRADGAYELVDLKLGPLAEGLDDAGNAVNFYPILDGLSAGDEVVVQGGFLLDSQRQIEGMPSLLYAEGRSAASLHAGHGEAPNSVGPGGNRPMPESSTPHQH